VQFERKSLCFGVVYQNDTATLINGHGQECQYISARQTQELL